MHKLLPLLALLCLPLFANAQHRAFLAGSGQGETFNCVFQLSNGNLLVGGSAPDLNWLPAGTPVAELAGTAGLRSKDLANRAFILHLTPDLQTILDVVAFPPGTVTGVTRIKTNGLPGAPTEDLFISGERKNDTAAADGYYIAKLNANFLAASPTYLHWTYNVICQGRNATSVSENKTLQPWDVGGDGRVVVGSGTGFSTNWADIKRLDPAGIPEIVPAWRSHKPAKGGEFNKPIWEYHPDSTITNPLLWSQLPLKAGRLGSLRSATRQEHDSLMADENGNTDRKGLYPDDYYFTGPCVPGGTCPGGPGYTGYRVGPNPTQRLGGIAVDRRTGDFYFGYSTQTILPDGLPDFEPVLVAMYFDGTLKWWARLYKQQPSNSTPDQYVDAVGIDYANNMVVVGARCHGNNTVNLWQGNSISANPTARGFQNRFTGNNGNIHISWFGKLELNSGALMHSTYMAEFIEGSTSWGTNYTKPLYRQWPNFNGGNPNVNTTRIAEMHVATDGSVCVLGTGRRTFTTANAMQRMPHPRSSGVGSWNMFCRVYSPDLSEVKFSSTLTGRWDTLSGTGGNNTTLRGLFATDNGVIVTGTHAATGNLMPVASPAPWGDTTLNGAKALVAQFAIDSLPFMVGNKPALAETELSIYPNPSAGKVTIEGSGPLQQAQVFDRLGRQVYSQKATGLSAQLDLQSLPAGLYLLSVTDASGRNSWHKLMKE